jgi:hypothetical protein
MEQGIHMRFFKQAVQNAKKSEEEKRPVFEDRDYIEIKVAGNAREVFIGPVNDQHRKRFPIEWKMYQDGQAPSKTGTPITQWNYLTPSQVAMLQSLHIQTVEDIASLSDMNLQQVGMGAQKLRQEARSYLSLAQQQADAGKLEELKVAIEEKDATIAQQGQRLADLEARVEALINAGEKKSKKEKAEA